MSTPVGTNELVDVAAALGWRPEAVERLLTDVQTHAALRAIVEMGTDLREVAPVSDSAIARWTAALDRESRSEEPLAAEPAAQAQPVADKAILPRATRALVVGLAAAATMLFALLTTGARPAGSPAPVLAVAGLVGLLVCARELTRPLTEGTLLPPRNRRLRST